MLSDRRAMDDHEVLMKRIPSSLSEHTGIGDHEVLVAHIHASFSRTHRHNSSTVLGPYVRLDNTHPIIAFPHAQVQQQHVTLYPKLIGLSIIISSGHVGAICPP
jgi:hypothetical protein